MGHVEKAIEELVKKVSAQEQELLESKKTINRLCLMVNKQPLYTISEEKTGIADFGELRGDEYYGRPLATVITKILQKRNVKGSGPATIREIYEEMKAGGYQFGAKNDENAMKTVRNNMTKNQKFHQLPNGKFGLKEWYPVAQESTKNGKGPKKQGRGRPKKSEQLEGEQDTRDEKEQ
jgi:hypothetical protein